MPLNQPKNSVLACALILASSVLLTSCGIGAEDSPVPKRSFHVAADKSLAEAVPESIKGDGSLNIAVSVGTAPDAFNDEFGNLVGWEVDVARAAAAKLNLRPKFTNVTFDSIIPGLQGNRYDIAFGQMGITDDRMEKVDQVSTGLSNQAFVAPTETDSTVRDLADLCGMSIGISRGTRQQDFAEKQTAKCADSGDEPIGIQVYDGTTEANLAMLSGRADVSWSGSTGMNYFVKTSKGKAKIVGHYLEPYPLGGALPKGSEFSQSYADAVNALIDDGTYQEIMNKWSIPDSIIDKSEVNPEVEEQ